MFVKFYQIDFVGNDISQRNSFEFGSKLWSLLEKSLIFTPLEYENEYKKFYYLDFLSLSRIWSTEYDLEYEFVLEIVL